MLKFAFEEKLSFEEGLGVLIIHVIGTTTSIAEIEGLLITLSDYVKQIEVKPNIIVINLNNDEFKKATAYFVSKIILGITREVCPLIKVNSIIKQIKIACQHENIIAALELNGFHALFQISNTVEEIIGN